MRVNLTDLSLLGKVIDGATKAGASNINRLTFGLRDEKAARGRALSEAADQAKAGAESLAATLQLKLIRIVRVRRGAARHYFAGARDRNFAIERRIEQQPIALAGQHSNPRQHKCNLRNHRTLTA